MTVLNPARDTAYRDSALLSPTLLAPSKRRLPALKRLSYAVGVAHSVVAVQSVAICALCAADLASTLWLCGSHGAAEGNPLMAFFLTKGPTASVAAKSALTVGPLVVLEVVRRKRPRLALLALNTVLFCYIAFYGVGVARVNSAEPREAVRSAQLSQEIEAVYRETARRIAAKRR